LFLIPDGQQNRDVAPERRGGRKEWGAPPPLFGPECQAEQTTAEQKGGGERAIHGSTGSGSLFEGRLDLAGIGKAACLLLGVEQLIVDGDLEDATGSLDELGFDAELLLDLLRQTGGAGVVVSDAAVLDDDGCGHGPPPFGPHYSRAAPSPQPLEHRGSLLFKQGIRWRERLLSSL
jgi:hypothetical protein